VLLLVMPPARHIVVIWTFAGPRTWLVILAFGLLATALAARRSDMSGSGENRADRK
jgi:hypothetical protein